MYHKAEKLYYALAIFALFTSLFFLHPSINKVMADLQKDIQEQFRVALIQTVGDQIIGSEVGEVITAIESFYESASVELLALLQTTPADEDVVLVARNIILSFANMNSQEGSVAGVNIESFMIEDPVYNIIPDPKEPQDSEGPDMLFELPSSILEPVAAENAWVTLTDNITGQPYCVGIYNGEVNQYMGVCQYDYH